MPWFDMHKSFWGPYISVRVRSDNGYEDTVDRLYSAADVRRVYKNLAKDMRPLLTQDEMERLAESLGK